MHRVRTKFSLRGSSRGHATVDCVGVCIVAALLVLGLVAQAAASGRVLDAGLTAVVCRVVSAVDGSACADPVLARGSTGGGLRSPQVLVNAAREGGADATPVDLEPRARLDVAQSTAEATAWKWCFARSGTQVCAGVTGDVVSCDAAERCVKSSGGVPAGFFDSCVSVPGPAALHLRDCTISGDGTGDETVRCAGGAGAAGATCVDLRLAGADALCVRLDGARGGAGAKARGSLPGEALPDELGLLIRGMASLGSIARCSRSTALHFFPEWAQHTPGQLVDATGHVLEHATAGTGPANGGSLLQHVVDAVHAAWSQVAQDEDLQPAVIVVQTPAGAPIPLIHFEPGSDGAPGTVTIPAELLTDDATAAGSIDPAALTATANAVALIAQHPALAADPMGQQMLTALVGHQGLLDLIAADPHGVASGTIHVDPTLEVPGDPTLGVPGQPAVATMTGLMASVVHDMDGNLQPLTAATAHGPTFPFNSLHQTPAPLVADAVEALVAVGAPLNVATFAQAFLNAHLAWIPTQSAGGAVLPAADEVVGLITNFTGTQDAPSLAAVPEGIVNDYVDFWDQAGDDGGEDSDDEDQAGDPGANAGAGVEEDPGDDPGAGAAGAAAGGGAAAAGDDSGASGSSAEGGASGAAGASAGGAAGSRSGKGHLDPLQGWHLPSLVPSRAGTAAAVAALIWRLGPSVVRLIP